MPNKRDFGGPANKYVGRRTLVNPPPSDGLVHVTPASKKAAAPKSRKGDAKLTRQEAKAKAKESMEGMYAVHQHAHMHTPHATCTCHAHMHR